MRLVNPNWGGGGEWTKHEYFRIIEGFMVFSFQREKWSGNRERMKKLKGARVPERTNELGEPADWPCYSLSSG